MKISIPKESVDSETRVAVTPHSVSELIKAGYEVSVQSGAGNKSYISDDLFIKAGAKIVDSSAKLLKDAAIILRVAPPSLDEISVLAEKSICISFFQPTIELEKVSAMSKLNITGMSMHLVPRTTLAQKMDALSSQANIAGYKAVLMGSTHMSVYMPLLMTAAGTIRPAKVLILGAGVAGLQAIATAKRMGAVVSATDVRRAAGEQCESLGASFIMVDEDEDSEDSGGYAKEMSDDYKKRQNALIAEHLKSQDIVICTALIPGRPAPILLTSEMVSSMKKGSVIVDMAIERGGNCELTKSNENVLIEGVNIVGDLNMISGLAPDASNLYSRNLYSFLSLFVDLESEKKLNWEDDIVSAVSVVKDKKVSEGFNK